MSGCTYFTPGELEACRVLDASTPYAIWPVTGTIFSVARHSGGATYQNQSYRYLPEHDALVRQDVRRLVESLRKLQAKAKRAEDSQRAKAAQGALL
jgi:hypothetical protein